ncbi:MAG: gamma-glutamyl-gamma-aminobutyrate hydrolase family protein [Pseudomonadota bacterium]
MTRPVIGIACSHTMVEDTYAVQMTGERTMNGVGVVSEGLPLMIPGMPCSIRIQDLVNTLDGLVLTGGRANVHPKFYGEELTDAHGTMDENRDEVLLPLIRACIDVGIPILGLCRGIQEMNVAMGGTLYPEVGALPGRHRHRMIPGCKDAEVTFEKREEVSLRPGGELQRMLGDTVIWTNSLHGQAVKDPGKRVVIEGWAKDDTVEAISIEGARTFTIGVQWHAEYEPDADPVSRILFGELGNAARARQARRLGANAA